ncbi:MAG: hypothetical protein JSW00_10300 [Thermoplasmata archaeon]|nr:MAG: hypothetical protein JSW00_10300 [Thermoplasmata archaeon]
MKGITRLFAIIVSFVFLIEVLAFTAAGDAEMPEWKEGDQWKYQMTAFGMSVPVTYEVSEITFIDVNDKNYEVYDLKFSIMGSEQHHYYHTSSMGLVKTKIPTYIGSEEKLLEYVYDPPKKEYDFPLTEGKKWTSSHTSSTYDDDYGWMNSTEDIDYEVVEIETITVEAGTFECYRIDSEDDYGYTNTSVWYSPKVKNMVKSSVEAFGIETEMELTSYSIAGGNGDGNGDGSDLLSNPLMLLLIIIPIIIVVLVVVLVMKGKSKRAGERAAYPPGAPPSVPPTQPAPSQPPATAAAPPPQQYGAPQPMGQAQAPPQQHFCPTCNRPLSFVAQYNRWFCGNCNRYL